MSRVDALRLGSLLEWCVMTDNELSDWVRSSTNHSYKLISDSTVGEVLVVAQTLMQRWKIDGIGHVQVMHSSTYVPSVWMMVNFRCS